jgi:hypothetical protein
MDKLKGLPKFRTLTTENHKRSITGWAIALLLVTAIGWGFVFQEMSPEAKYGQHCEFHTVGHVVCAHG